MDLEFFTKNYGKKCEGCCFVVNSENNGQILFFKIKLDSKKKIITGYTLLTVRQNDNLIIKKYGNDEIYEQLLEFGEETVANNEWKPNAKVNIVYPYCKLYFDTNATCISDYNLIHNNVSKVLYDFLFEKIDEFDDDYPTEAEFDKWVVLNAAYNNTEIFYSRVFYTSGNKEHMCLLYYNCLCVKVKNGSICITGISKNEGGNTVKQLNDINRVVLISKNIGTIEEICTYRFLVEYYLSKNVNRLLICINGNSEIGFYFFRDTTLYSITRSGDEDNLLYLIGTSKDNIYELHLVCGFNAGVNELKANEILNISEKNQYLLYYANLYGVNI